MISHFCSLEFLKFCAIYEILRIEISGVLGWLGFTKHFFYQLLCYVTVIASGLGLLPFTNFSCIRFLLSLLNVELKIGIEISLQISNFVLFYELFFNEIKFMRKIIK